MNIEDSSAIEPVLFFSAGERMSGDLYLPRSRRSQPTGFPAVIFCHGWGGMKDQLVPQFASLLNSDGFAVLGFDYRGYGASEGKPNRLHPLEQAEDVLAAATFLGHDERIDARRLTALGILTGSGAATVAASWSEAISSVVCFYPFGDGGRWLRMMRSHWQWLELLDACNSDRLRRTTEAMGELIDPDDVLMRDPAGRVREGLARQSNALRRNWRLGYDSVDALLRFRPEDYLRRIPPRPVMAIAIEQDRMMPIDEVRRFMDSYDGPHELLVIRDCNDHQELYQAEQLTAVIARVVKFMQGAATQLRI